MNYVVYFLHLKKTHLFNSTENGEKVEKEAEAKPEPTPEEPKPERATKTKKEKRPAKGAGFELWNELDVQRNKFMVGEKAKYNSLQLHFSQSFLFRFTQPSIFRTVCPATSTTFVSWLCSSPLPSTLFCSFTRSVLPFHLFQCLFGYSDI